MSTIPNHLLPPGKKNGGVASAIPVVIGQVVAPCYSGEYDI